MVKQDQTVSKQASALEKYFPPTDTQLNNPIQEFENKHPTYKEFRALGLDKKGLGPNDYKEDGTLIILPNGNPSSVEEQIVNHTFFRSMRKHLSRIDLTKGPIRRKILNMQRKRAYSFKEKKWVEYLLTRVQWNGKDYMNNDVEVSGILEGFYNIPKMESKNINGRVTTTYRNWEAGYDIPFSPETIDESIFAEGQEQPPELIKFYIIKPDNTRDDTFTYEQFKTKTFDELRELSRTGKNR